MIRISHTRLDFACRSAHYKLRSKMASIANSAAKRACLICLHGRKVVVDDTEWHLLFGCCATAEHRSKHVASINDNPLPTASLPTSPFISTVVHHFLFARETSDNQSPHICPVCEGQHASSPETTASAVPRLHFH